MKTSWLLGVSALCCTAVGAVAARVIWDRPDHDASAADVAMLTREIQGLSDKLKSLESAQAQLVARPSASSEPLRVPVDEIDRAVARYLASKEAKPAESATGAVAKAPASAALDVDAAVVDLLDPTLTYEKREAIYAKLKDANLLDQVIAKLEAKSKATASDPDSHVTLAEAYLQRVFITGDGPERGAWATKADHEFDAALQLNPNHWNARFSKAVSLSFWPPLFGKQEEAARQFETLVQQQEQSGRSQPEHASTYLFLGNLYSQMGKSDKAMDAWRKGLGLFPDSKDLRDKVDAAK